jgi:hypothetical protein
MKLFQGAAIDETPLGSDKAIEDYFGENRAVFYPLLFAALKVNFEKDFSMLRGVVGALPGAAETKPKK